jgi:hypothetical protein
VTQNAIAETLTIGEQQRKLLEWTVTKCISSPLDNGTSSYILTDVLGLL